MKNQQLMNVIFKEDMILENSEIGTLNENETNMRWEYWQKVIECYTVWYTV